MLQAIQTATQQRKKLLSHHGGKGMHGESSFFVLQMYQGRVLFSSWALFHLQKYCKGIDQYPCFDLEVIWLIDKLSIL